MPRINFFGNGVWTNLEGHVAFGTHCLGKSVGT